MAQQIWFIWLKPKTTISDTVFFCAFLFGLNFMNFPESQINIIYIREVHFDIRAAFNWGYTLLSTDVGRDSIFFLHRHHPNPTNKKNNPNTYLVPSHTCLGYVWVGILSLIVALLLYTPWRLSRDNYDAWQ